MNKRIRKKKGLGKIRKEELWDLDCTICKFIIPRLEKFKIVNIMSYPERAGSFEEWHKIIDKIIWSFRFALEVSNGQEEDEENWNRYYEGMDLFKEYFTDLWD